MKVPVVRLRHKRKKGRVITVDATEYARDLSTRKYIDYERIGEEHAERPEDVVEVAVQEYLEESAEESPEEVKEESPKEEEEEKPRIRRRRSKK